MRPTQSTLALSLGEEDIARLADAVAERLELNGERRWLTVHAAAEYTSLSKDAIRTAAKRGKLESQKGASGRLVFTTEALDSFMGGVE
jgi:hypothetical protein